MGKPEKAVQGKNKRIGRKSCWSLIPIFTANVDFLSPKEEIKLEIHLFKNYCHV